MTLRASSTAEVEDWKAALDAEVRCTVNRLLFRAFPFCNSYFSFSVCERACAVADHCQASAPRHAEHALQDCHLRYWLELDPGRLCQPCWFEQRKKRIEERGKGSLLTRLSLFVVAGAWPQIYIPASVAINRKDQRRTCGFESLHPDVRQTSDVVYPFRYDQPTTKRRRRRRREEIHQRKSG